MLWIARNISVSFKKYVLWNIVFWRDCYLCGEIMFGWTLVGVEFSGSSVLWSFLENRMAWTRRCLVTFCQAMLTWRSRAFECKFCETWYPLACQRCRLSSPWLRASATRSIEVVPEKKSEETLCYTPRREHGMQFAPCIVWEFVAAARACSRPRDFVAPGYKDNNCHLIFPVLLNYLVISGAWYVSLLITPFFLTLKFG